jgi:hypothetical protein
MTYKQAVFLLSVGDGIKKYTYRTIYDERLEEHAIVCLSNYEALQLLSAAINAAYQVGYHTGYDNGVDSQLNWGYSQKGRPIPVFNTIQIDVRDVNRKVGITAYILY